MTPAGTPGGTPGSTRWLVHGERVVYDSSWVRLCLIDVEEPGGRRYEHHAVRTPAAAAGCLVLDRDPDLDKDRDVAGRVLLLWRHRLVPDRWGWEVPAGRLEPGESPATAAAREALEETGHGAHEPRLLASFNPVGGLSDHTFHVVLATDGGRLADPDPAEAERIAWFTRDEVADLLRRGEVREGLSVVALLWWLSGLSGPGAPVAADP